MSTHKDEIRSWRWRNPAIDVAVDGGGDGEFEGQDVAGIVFGRRWRMFSDEGDGEGVVDERRNFMMGN